MGTFTVGASLPSSESTAVFHLWVTNGAASAGVGVLCILLFFLPSRGLGLLAIPLLKIVLKTLPPAVALSILHDWSLLGWCT